MRTCYMLRQFCPSTCLSVHLSVCPSVCLSVRRRYCVETVNYIIKLFSPSGSHTIVVFLRQTLWPYSDGDPLTAALNVEVWKNRDFAPIFRCISEMIQNRTEKLRDIYDSCSYEPSCYINDLTQLPKDTGPRALSLRQLSFLFLWLRY